MNQFENFYRGKLAFSVGEAVIATGLSRASLYRAINTQRLKSRRIGGRRIIITSDLLAFLQGGP